MRNALRALLVVTIVAACAPDAVAPVQHVDVSRLFWALTLDHHAVTLSTMPPYDTLRLTAIPRTSDGTALGGAPTPRFKSADIERVQVDSTGLLHAIKVGRNIPVVATDTMDNIVHTDTVWVTVTSASPPPVLATLDFSGLDSAKYALGGSPLLGDPPTLSASAADPDGNPIDELAVHYASSDPHVATVDPVTGALTLRQVGHVTLVASATAYGVTRADTLPLTVELPIFVLVELREQRDARGQTVVAFSSPTTIGVNGDIAWVNSTSAPIEVTFDDPTSAMQDDVACSLLGDPFCSSGDIVAFGNASTGDNIRLRQFRVPGTYHYRVLGTSGTVVVRQE